MKAIDFVKGRIKNLEALLLIMNDARARRVLVAWTYYRPAAMRTAHIEVKETNDPYLVLAELWRQVGEIDMSRLGDLSDVPASRVAKIFWRLKEAVLIWPDGTLTEPAQRLIVAEAETAARGLIPRTNRAK